MVSIPASPDALYDAYVPSLLFHKRFDEASLSGHKLSSGAGGCEARDARRHIDGVARRCCGGGLRRTAQVRAMLAPPPFSFPPCLPRPAGCHLITPLPALPASLHPPLATSARLRHPCSAAVPPPLRLAGSEQPCGQKTRQQGTH